MLSLNETLEQRVAERTAAAVERAEKLRILTAELSVAEQRERRRIVEVLHDDLQQMLVATRMHFATLCNATRAGKGDDGIQRQIADTLEQCFELTRSLSA